MKAKWYLVLLIASFYSCFPLGKKFYNEKELKGVFTGEDISAFKKNLHVKSIKDIIITPILIDSNSNIGLWKYRIKNVGIGGFVPFLKGKNEIYFCDEGITDSLVNNEVVGRFFTRYGELFNIDQKGLIRDKFLSGRFYEGVPDDD